MRVKRYTPTMRLEPRGTSTEMADDEHGNYVHVLDYDRLYGAAKRVTENFEAYGSAIKVTVAMALIEQLQQALSREEGSSNG